MKRTAYYEIICSVGVIGVCSGDYLLHAAKEDNVLAFGRISKKDFERYGDNDWVKPISKKRYSFKIEQQLKLFPAK